MLRHIFGTTHLIFKFMVKKLSSSKEIILQVIFPIFHKLFGTVRRIGPGPNLMKLMNLNEISIIFSEILRKF